MILAGQNKFLNRTTGSNDENTVNVYPTKPKSIETRREPGWLYTYNGNCKSYRRTSKNHIFQEN